MGSSSFVLVFSITFVMALSQMYHRSDYKNYNPWYRKESATRNPQTSPQPTFLPPEVYFESTSNPTSEASVSTQPVVTATEEESSTLPQMDDALHEEVENIPVVSSLLDYCNNINGRDCTAAELQRVLNSDATLDYLKEMEQPFLHDVIQNKQLRVIKKRPPSERIVLNIHPDIRERLERVFCLGEIGTCSEELWPLARVFVALRKTVLTSQDIINGFEMAQEDPHLDLEALGNVAEKELQTQIRNARLLTQDMSAAVQVIAATSEMEGRKGFFQTDCLTKSLKKCTKHTKEELQEKLIRCFVPYETVDGGKAAVAKVERNVELIRLPSNDDESDTWLEVKASEYNDILGKAVRNTPDFNFELAVNDRIVRPVTCKGSDLETIANCLTNVDIQPSVFNTRYTYLSVEAVKHTLQFAAAAVLDPRTSSHVHNVKVAASKILASNDETLNEIIDRNTETAVESIKDLLITKTLIPPTFASTPNLDGRIAMKLSSLKQAQNEYNLCLVSKRIPECWELLVKHFSVIGSEGNGYDPLEHLKPPIAEEINLELVSSIRDLCPHKICLFRYQEDFNDILNLGFEDMSHFRAIKNFFQVLLVATEQDEGDALIIKKNNFLLFCKQMDAVFGDITLPAAIRAKTLRDISHNVYEIVNDIEQRTTKTFYENKYHLDAVNTFKAECLAWPCHLEFTQNSLRGEYKKCTDLQKHFEKVSSLVSPDLYSSQSPMCFKNSEYYFKEHKLWFDDSLVRKSLANKIMTQIVFKRKGEDAQKYKARQQKSLSKKRSETPQSTLTSTEQPEPASNNLPNPSGNVEINTNSPPTTKTKRPRAKTPPPSPDPEYDRLLRSRGPVSEDD